MKRICKRFLLLTFACLYAFPIFANHGDPRIVNLSEAKFYSGHSQAIYIRTRHFTKLPNAQRYRSKIITKVRYPVSVAKRGQEYTVLVGPIQSSSHVRQAAMTIAAVTKKHHLHHAHHPVKHKQAPVVAMTKPVASADVPPTLTVVNKSATQSSKSLSMLTPEPHSKHTQLDSTKTQHDATAHSPNHWFFTLGAGLQYPQFNNVRTRINNGSGFPPPSDYDIYTFKNQQHPVLELAGGYRFVRNARWLPAYSVGANYQYLFSNNIGGTIMQYSLPSFTNYTFNWNVSAHVLLAEGKLNLIEYKQVMPFINAGVGAASIRSNGYSEQPFPGVTARDSADFEDKTMTKVAYALGAGVDYQISSHFIATAAYQYLNLGDISTGVGAGSWAGKSLYLGSYHSNEGLVSVTYLFDNAG